MASDLVIGCIWWYTPKTEATAKSCCPAPSESSPLSGTEMLASGQVVPNKHFDFSLDFKRIWFVANMSQNSFGRYHFTQIRVGIVQQLE